MANRKEDENDAELDHALAILISNTRRNKRPLPLTEIGKWLSVAVKKLGSHSAVADRLGLSAKMLKQFSNVSRLAPDLRQLVETRKLDSLDAVSHLAVLPAKQQEIVADALAAGEINTSDIRAVAQLQRLHYSDSIKEILKRVKDGKTKREYIAEFVVRGSHDSEQILKAFQRHVPPKDIIRVEIDGSLGRLVLTQAGKKELFNAADALGVSINQVIPVILKG
jgi:DNA-binding transcriptional regulator YdaS (Cro superfamily)